MNSTSTGSGLLMITPSSEVLLVLSKKPYKNNIKLINNVEMPDSLNMFGCQKKNATQQAFFFKGFVEKFCIPRGRKKNHHESFFCTATREFLEEVQIKIQGFDVLDTYFRLTWIDSASPLKTYQYNIFIGFLFNNDLASKKCFFNKQLSLTVEENFFDFQCTVIESVENNIQEASLQMPCSIKIDEFFTFMETSQIKMYKKTNYRELFEFIRKILRLYTSMQLKPLYKKAQQFKLFDSTQDQNNFGIISIKLNYNF